MRLIDVKTLELQEFFDPAKMPPYAILSHVWRGEEVTFQEWERVHPPSYMNPNPHHNSNTNAAITRKSGYAKIIGACRRARADGFQYVWCDTNCIDKRSSAELSEAINSMYAWYRDSKVCYAYLFDVETKPQPGSFAKSLWFTRGWTLQELLAPTHVIFFSNEWKVLGDRKTVAGQISEITRIHIGALMDRETIREYSIAQRMSWAADRNTTRKEDIAYCLLGIFDINMPLLYGEGLKAFSRLQQEIIKVSDDQSILAWDLQNPNSQPWTSSLASSPTRFRLCGSIVRDSEIEASPYSITNLGISMNVPIIKTLDTQVVLAGLNCARELRGRSDQDIMNPESISIIRQYQVWIPLRRLGQQKYLKGHLPSSKIFLHQSYPQSGHPTLTDIFIGIGAPYFIPTNAPEKHLALMSSGLFFTVASGIMLPRVRMFKEVYPLGDLYMRVLKSRGISTLSHQLLSSDNLTVFFSIYWDKDGCPVDWEHTTVVDPKLQVSNRMASQREWSCLFGELSNHSCACCNTASSLQSLHNRLRQAYGKPLEAYIKEERTPWIWVESQRLFNLFGQQEVVVDVTFRDPPRFMSARVS
ncbi:HET-domain-containing protein [Whalleya microplaca]|nr:HET-domain-containing protein [Whalleya microplaca]